jgi:hypothetical protein
MRRKVVELSLNDPRAAFFRDLDCAIGAIRIKDDDLIESRETGQASLQVLFLILGWYKNRDWYGHTLVVHEKRIMV